MTTNNNLIIIIRLAPLFIVIVFTVLITGFVLQDNQSQAKRELDSLRENFIAQQKVILKSEVDQLNQDIEYERTHTEDILRENIKIRVDEVYEIIQNIHQNYPNLSEEEAVKLVSSAFKSIRFNNERGYYTIFTSKSIMIMHPSLPIGQSLYDFQNSHGQYVVRELAESATSKGEAYSRWWFPKPDLDNKDYEKIGFGKYFEPYDWVIVLGEYIDDVENDIKARIVERFKSIQYGENGFVFAFDSTGELFIHASEELLEAEKNRDRSEPRSKIREDVLKISKQGGGFYEYIAPLNPATGNPERKLSYIGAVNDWGWSVGTGVYLSEIEHILALKEAEISQQNKHKIFIILILSLLLTIILICLSLVLSNVISTRFKNYQKTISNDFSVLEKTKNEMEHMALHDALTGLPNRALLSEQINQGIDISAVENKLLAVMFLDLDDFKKINDLYGHTSGDQLLQKLGSRFKSIVSTIDNVARFGGDEFVFSFPLLDDLSAAEHKVELVRNACIGSFSIDGLTLFSSASIGVAMFPADGNTAEELISKADIVLNKSKNNKKGQVLFYNDSINTQVQHDFMLEEKLRSALTRNEITVLYQPQMNAKANVLCGVEALARWSNSTLGQVSPVEFIKVAEDIGIVNEIGMFVLKTACEDMFEYCKNGSYLNLSINISPKQLLDESFADAAYAAVKESGFPVNKVTLEITENVMIHNPETVVSILQKLQNFGFGLSLDDFGTGFSSLSYINTLPINEIKIDRSFVDKMLTNEQSDSLVKAILAIGFSCKKNVVAEGVETIEQLEKLVSYHCKIVQGYYFDKPLTLNQLQDHYA